MSFVVTKRYDYHLEDDSGVSEAWDQKILIPIGTKFLHDFGLYEVREYRDESGELTDKRSKIKGVWCQRLKSNQQLKEG